VETRANAPLADAGFPRSGERSNGKEVSSEKEMCAVRKKAAPLETLGNSSGFLRVFPEAQAAPLAPLAKCSRFFDGFWRGEALRRCAPGENCDANLNDVARALEPENNGLFFASPGRRDVSLRDTVAWPGLVCFAATRLRARVLLVKSVVGRPRRGGGALVRENWTPGQRTKRRQPDAMRADVAGTAIWRIPESFVAAGRWTA